MISGEKAETKENKMEHLGIIISNMFLGINVDYLIYQANYLKIYHAALSRARISSSFLALWSCLSWLFPSDSKLPVAYTAFARFFCR